MKLKPAHMILLAILAVIAVLVLPQVLADQPGARSTQGDIITETINVIETNDSADFAVRLLEGSDATHESDHMFESLLGLPGVGKASLDVQALTLTVAYDATLTTDEQIRMRLIEAGYSAPTRADATPAELAEDGSTQHIYIEDDGTRFDPYLISAQAGVPIEIDFAPGQECRASVKFPDLGIEQDISQGGTVTLPGLEPGDYLIRCGGDGDEGVIFVQ